MRQFGLPEAVAVLAVVALLPAAPWSVRAAPAELGAIKIATQSPLSGRQADLGEGIRKGAQLAVDQLAGPLTKMGFKVELVPFDDQAKPSVGAANAKTLAADPDILLVVGHLNSAVAIPSSEVYKDSSLAMISPANTHPDVTERKITSVFRVVSRDDMQGIAGAEFAARELKARSVFIVHDMTAYGRGTAERFRHHTPRVGMKALGFEGTGERAEFDPIILTMKDRNLDVIYFGGTYDRAGVFFKQARARGLKARFLGPDGMDSSALARMAGDAVVGMHYTAIVGPALIYRGAAQFTSDYRAKYHRDPPPFAAQAYDATAIGLAAIARAVKAGGGKKPARGQVTEEIRQTRGFRGVTGTFAFDAKGDAVPASYFVLRVVSGDPARWNDNVLVRRLEISP